VLGRLPRFALETVIYGGFILMLIIMVLTKSEALQDALPTFGLIGMAGMKLFPALQAIYNNLASIRYSGEALTNLHTSVVQLTNVVRDDAAGRPVRLNNALELRDVTFRYPGTDTLTLDRMTLKIPAHTTCGIVGGTGAGKTTVIDLILGLLRPLGGDIVVDGAVLADADVRSWQKGIGYVPQAIYLSDASIAENIAFGVSPENIDHAAVERAARIANLHDFVMSDLPQGYDTTVGERGVRRAASAHRHRPRAVL
jgi:ATP-binding cassette, subfamily B, bacterial PglK